MAVSDLGLVGRMGNGADHGGRQNPIEGGERDGSGIAVDVDFGVVVGLVPVTGHGNDHSLALEKVVGLAGSPHHCPKGNNRDAVGPKPKGVSEGDPANDVAWERPRQSFFSQVLCDEVRPQRVPHQKQGQLAVIVHPACYLVDDAPEVACVGRRVGPWRGHGDGVSQPAFVFGAAPKVHGHGVPSPVCHGPLEALDISVLRGVVDPVENQNCRMGNGARQYACFSCCC